MAGTRVVPVHYVIGVKAHRPVTTPTTPLTTPFLVSMALVGTGRSNKMG